MLMLWTPELTSSSVFLDVNLSDSLLPQYGCGIFSSEIYTNCFFGYHSCCQVIIFMNYFTHELVVQVGANQ